MFGLDLSPEAIFRSLVGALGITPKEVVDAVQEVMAEVRTIKAEREAFKMGAAHVVVEFTARLTAQDERLKRIETLLLDLNAKPVAGATVAPAIPLNGATHVGH